MSIGTFGIRQIDNEHFRLERIGAQNVLRFLPAPSFADVRLFMRGPLLDGTDGMAVPIYKNLGAVLDNSRPLIAPRQVHGVTILGGDSSVVPAFDEGDAVFLTSSSVCASLRFADCAPLVIMPSEEWARENSPWVLIAHSGYKGTVQNIAGAAVDAIERTFGRSAADSASAWIGPCIGGGSYPRTMEEWTERGLKIFHSENVMRSGEHILFDIGGEIRCQLAERGIKRVSLFGTDTMKNTDVCYSYRGGDAQDRMFLLAGLIPDWQ